MADHASVQSVERAFAIIEQLCGKTEMGITELSTVTGMHKATVFRLLNTLVARGYVRRNSQTEKYGLTMKFLKISSARLADSDMRTVAGPYLERLSQACGETVHLVERDGSDIVYIDKFESTQNAVRMVSRIGLVLPMIHTAVGKAILAQMQDETVLAIWNRSDKAPKTTHTITGFDSFMQEINTVRQSGFAVDNEENEIGVRCIAAALPEMGGCTHAFSISAPVARMTDERIKQLAQALFDTKRQILG